MFNKVYNAKPDFVVFLDKDILLAQYLKNEGIPVFNDPDVIEICDNKARQYMALAKAQVPMPTNNYCTKSISRLYDSTYRIL